MNRRLQYISDVLNRNTNKSGLEKKVQIKYDNNKIRIVAPIATVDDTNKNLRFAIQTGGYSESGLSKSINSEKRNSENTRALDITKIRWIKEIK